MQLKTNFGRNRLNILGAYSPDEGSLIRWEGRELCDAERVVALLTKIRAANPGERLLVVLDNAPYNKAQRFVRQQRPCESSCYICRPIRPTST